MGTDGDVVRFGVFELDPRRRELRKQGRVVRIQDKPFDLLLLLIERAGDVVSREDLRRRLWAEDTFVEFDANLNTAVRKAREALGDAADGARFIETVPRRGYRFIAPVAKSAVATDIPPAERPASAATRSPQRTRLYALALALTVAASGLVALTLTSTHAGSAERPMQFRLSSPKGTYFPAGAPQAALSRDGREVAFLAGSLTDRVHRLWIQSLDSVDPRPIPGTEYAFAPFWSPDGKRVAFASYQKIRILNVADGTVRELLSAPDSGGGTWNEAGDILLGSPTTLIRVSEHGGPALPVTTVDATAGEIRHLFPQFLDDGRRFFYLALNRDPDRTAVYMGSLDAPVKVRVLTTRHKALFVPPDRVVYVRGGALVMDRFNPGRGEVSGNAETIAPEVGVVDVTGAASFAVSGTGAIVYTGRRTEPLRQLVWFSRTGARIRTASHPAQDMAFDLSPDDRWAAVQRFDVNAGAPDVWLLDLERGVATHATSNPANDESPVWAPDSLRFTYARHRGIQEDADIHWMRRDDPSIDEPIVMGPPSDHPTDWAADGVVLFERPDQWGTSDIWVADSAKRAAPSPWLATRFMEHQAKLSADGRWVAYSSDESGRSEVYVRSFRDGRRKWQISASGGAQPKWSRDGRELFFVSAAQQLMAARVRGGEQFDADAPVELADLSHLIGAYTDPSFAPARDASRFLVSTIVDDPGEPKMTILLNARAVHSSIPLR